jgi:DNA invertase Pin-like site-specific DNA recombinase
MSSTSRRDLQNLGPRQFIAGVSADLSTQRMRDPAQIRAEVGATAFARLVDHAGNDRSTQPRQQQKLAALIQSACMKAAIYARVSTFDQEPENQLQEVRRYVEARGWSAQPFGTPAVEYVDRCSGSKDRRPALDQLVADAKRRRFDVLVVWRLDRLGRNLRHLILLLDELKDLGIAFVSLHEGIDATTPAGRLQLHILGAIAEFERARIQERVMAGLARARTQGKRLGRPRAVVAADQLDAVAAMSIRDAAAALGVSTATLKRRRRSSKPLSIPA